MAVPSLARRWVYVYTVLSMTLGEGAREELASSIQSLATFSSLAEQAEGEKPTPRHCLIPDQI
jgi:hypothetical protein